jgi:RNA polymerase sigma-70 factor (ECF subfamily)
MLGSAQDAEDQVQETLLRAWRALERFEPRVQLQTWLYRIATNACLDELERRPRRALPLDPFPERESDEGDAPTYDPAARYAIREGMELALLRAIQELPGRQRVILIFRDVLGWTAPEVAELLESTVASAEGPRAGRGGVLKVAHRGRSRRFATEARVFVRLGANRLACRRSATSSTFGRLASPGTVADEPAATSERSSCLG